MTDNNPAANPDHELARAIRDAVRDGVHMVRFLEDEGELSLTQIGILNTLASVPHPIGLLARISGMTQPGMSQQIDKLESAGMVRRVKDTRDARVTMVELTDLGGETRARDNLLRDAALSSHFDLISDSDRERIQDALGPFSVFAASYVQRRSEEKHE
ncbi:MAG: MarR family winged helix-turn-helix transcriptional regulator [Mycobacteriaceae bacterium]|uniref:MarR family winged helix-turn-helix transcriptional regulator n=1 Tax=Corynebacterium sp. TaxID=1720 RepID=UPI003F996108